MTKIKCWVCNRLREPSTWAGFGVVLTSALGGIQLASMLPAPYSTYAIAAVALCIICGAVAVLLGEKNENK